MEWDPVPEEPRLFLNSFFDIQHYAPSNLAKKEVVSAMALSIWGDRFPGPRFSWFEKVALGKHILLVASGSTPGPMVFVISHSDPLLLLNKSKLGWAGKYFTPNGRADEFTFSGESLRWWDVFEPGNPPSIDRPVN